MTDVGAAVAWLDSRLPEIAVTIGPPSVGTPGDRPDLLGDLVGAVQLVAGMLNEIHGLPVDDFLAVVPGGLSGWEAVAERIEGRAPIDTSTLPEPYSRYDHATLRRLWKEGRPETEELVICHGRPELPLIGFSDGAVVGIGLGDGGMGDGEFGSPLGPLVADRHLDLAVAHQSITSALGPEAVFAFYDAYEQPPDLVRLDHYVLASHLW